MHASSTAAPHHPRVPAEEQRLPRISVIVPVYDALPYLRACLDSLLDAVDEYGNAEVIVVDNGSTDGSWELLRARYTERITAMRAPDASVGGVRNRGANRADGDILSFLDADCEVGRHYLHAIASVLNDPGKDATGSRYALPEAPTWVEWVWHDLHERPTDGCVSYLNAGNFAVTKSAFQAAGGFREDLASGEDAELGQRITGMGFRIWESSDVIAVHHGNPKTLASFFRKQTWHAIGMFGTVGRGSVDKPVVMMAAHAAAILGGFTWLTVGAGPLPLRVLVAAGLTLPVPVASVLYRFLHGGAVQAPLRALVLYWVYFAARLRGLGILVRERFLPAAAAAPEEVPAALTKNLQRS